MLMPTSTARRVWPAAVVAVQRAAIRIVSAQTIHSGEIPAETFLPERVGAWVAFTLHLPPGSPRRLACTRRCPLRIGIGSQGIRSSDDQGLQRHATQGNLQRQFSLIEFPGSAMHIIKGVLYCKDRIHRHMNCRQAPNSGTSLFLTGGVPRTQRRRVVGLLLACTAPLDSSG